MSKPFGLANPIGCYVCGNEIKEGAVYIGQGKYRHKRCKPGTKRWIDAGAGHDPDVKQAFMEAQHA